MQDMIQIIEFNSKKICDYNCSQHLNFFCYAWNFEKKTVQDIPCYIMSSAQIPPIRLSNFKNNPIFLDPKFEKILRWICGAWRGLLDPKNATWSPDCDSEITNLV